MSVFVQLVRALVDAVEVSGVPRESLLRAAGIEDDRLRQDDSQFGLGEFARLQESALELTGNASLGLQLAERVRESSFDVVAYLVCHASCLRAAIEAASHFGGIFMDSYQLTLRERIDSATLVYEFPRTTPRSDRMQADFTIAGFLKLIRIFVGPRAMPISASFEYEMPRDSSEYQRVFGSGVCFSQPFTGLEFPRTFLSCAPLHSDPEIFSLLREKAAQTLERRASRVSHTESLRRYLQACVPARIPTMEMAARDLGLSARSLRRRLSEEGVSYRDLLRAELESSAVRFLTESHRSVSETAYAVGFSDPAAFQRAFKRWTGVTPTRFRAEHQRAAKTS